MIERAGDALSNICLAIAGAALLCIVAINGGNVLARYLFGSPFSWAEELMLFLMILAVFCGATAITWQNMHIRIDTVVDRMPPAAGRALRVLAALISIGVLATVAAVSLRLVSMLQSFDQRSDALHAPIWIPQSFVTVGLGLMALMIAVRLVTSRASGAPGAGSAKDER